MDITWTEAAEIYFALQESGDDDAADALDECMSPGPRDVKYGMRGDALDGFDPADGVIACDWDSLSSSDLREMIGALRAAPDTHKYVPRLDLAEKLAIFAAAQKRRNTRSA